MPVLTGQPSGIDKLAEQTHLELILTCLAAAVVTDSTQLYVSGRMLRCRASSLSSHATPHFSLQPTTVV